MENQLEIYHEKNRINNELKELKRKRQSEINKLNILQNQCPHELILVFDDYKPHLIGKIYYCFCPACGKKEDIYECHEFDKSSFKNSNRIDLTAFPMSTFKKDFQAILEHIFNNSDFYYSAEISELEKTQSILNFIEEKRNMEGKPITKTLIPKVKKDE